jgi:MFS transporter, DHA2 family, multidrug resistance protein
VSLLQPGTRDQPSDMQRYFMAHGFPDPAGALHRAVMAIGNTVRTQATIMGYADCFALLGVVLLVAILPVVPMRNGSASAGASH